MSRKPSAAEAEEQLVYEIEAMCRGRGPLRPGVGRACDLATPSGYEDAVFFLEAALLHARTLIITFGFPKDKDEKVTEALALTVDTPAFCEAFMPLGLSPKHVYGHSSELIVHIGGQRWTAPFGVHMHRPVRVAVTVLDSLQASGACISNAAIAAVVQAERVTLAGYL